MRCLEPNSYPQSSFYYLEAVMRIRIFLAVALFLATTYANAVVRVAPVRWTPVLSQTGVAGAHLKIGLTSPRALPSVSGALTRTRS